MSEEKKNKGNGKNFFEIGNNIFSLDIIGRIDLNDITEDGYLTTSFYDKNNIFIIDIVEMIDNSIEDTQGKTYYNEFKEYISE